jgi:hypothetical protein
MNKSFEVKVSGSINNEALSAIERLIWLAILIWGSSCKILNYITEINTTILYVNLIITGFCILPAK